MSTQDIDDRCADDDYERGRAVTAEQPVERTGPQLLTGSRMRAFRTCARLHQYQYVEGFRTAREPEYFRVGTLVHKGLEAWWQAGPQGGDRLEWALAAVAGLAFDPYEQATVEEMLRGYELRWGGGADAYEVIGVETAYEAPLLNPVTWAASRTWRLAGKIDGIVRRRADGRVLVLEHKTTGESIADDTASYWQKLALDHQISGYVIGAESLGHQVDEILYDVLRKPQQRPLLATPIESRKFTKDGRLYATQRDRDETPDEYRERVRAAIEADLFGFFVRREVPRTESQIREYMVDAWQQARAMRELELAGAAPRNPEACHRFGQCAFWQVCSTSSHPSDHPADYQKTDDVNPELAT